MNRAFKLKNVHMRYTNGYPYRLESYVEDKLASRHGQQKIVRDKMNIWDMFKDLYGKNEPEAKKVSSLEKICARLQIIDFGAKLLKIRERMNKIQEYFAKNNQRKSANE